MHWDDFGVIFVSKKFLSLYNNDKSDKFKHFLKSVSVPGIVLYTFMV